MAFIFAYVSFFSDAFSFCLHPLGAAALSLPEVEYSYPGMWISCNITASELESMVEASHTQIIGYFTIHCTKQAVLHE